MKLKKLFKNIPFLAMKGLREIEITGISSHSKLTAPGNLFIAKKGKNHDGSQFIKEAISAGAVAVVTDIYNPFLDNVAQIICSDPGKLEGVISGTYYNHPADDLLLIGITGTNGKTTTSFLIKQLLEEGRGPCGLLGTIEYHVGTNCYTASKTTPEAPLINKMLREMVNHGCRSAVMEVSSHSLDQGRVDCLDFDIAVFTNLTHEHLDYHGDMESYCLAKQKLFNQLDNTKQKKHKICQKTAIINTDDPWHEKMIQNTFVEIVRYGIDSPADVRATNVSITSKGTSFDLSYKQQNIRCAYPLIGRYNIYNALAAVAAVVTCGIPLEDIARKLQYVHSVPGRLEVVPNNLNLKIFVDYAHKPDALENVLQTLRELNGGDIITVFGCGGDRDREKRAKMAAISEKYSTLTIVTSDSPRSESPEGIADEIVKGFARPKSYFVDLDRSNAIKTAIERAKEGDIILIAGKGHERYQIFAHRTIEFDDKSEAMKACASRETLLSKSER